MKYWAMAVLLLALATYPLGAHAATYAALEGRDVYLGPVVLVFTGDDAAGDSESEFLPGLTVGGWAESCAWQVLCAGGVGEDALMLGGALDFYLVDNFDELACEPGQVCTSTEQPWWIGAGPTLVIYRDMFEGDGDPGVDGEELGLNAGAGLHWKQGVGTILIHYFPADGHSMISGSVGFAF